jgi:5'-nucleotidase
MRIVVTNDDGIDAPGIAALRIAIAAIPSLDPVVVAPRDHWSGCGHTLTTDRPIAAEERSPGIWAIAGSPADCVRVALTHLAPDAVVIVSGINQGGNLGTDLHCSGTIAAAREAALHGRRGVALSHYVRRGMPIDWPRAAAWVTKLLPGLLGGTGHVSVNLPHLDPGADMPEAVRCLLDPSPLPLAMERSAEGFRYRGDYHRRTRLAGYDIDTCFAGRISVVELG